MTDPIVYAIVYIIYHRCYRIEYSVRLDAMTESNNMSSQLETFIADLRERATRLETELSEIRAQIRDAERLLQAISGTGVPDQADAPPEWSCTVEDIKGCSSIREALEKMAALNGGTLLVTPAAKVLMEAKLTSGTLTASVAAGVYSRLRNRDEWARIGRGEFRYLGNADNS